MTPYTPKTDKLQRSPRWNNGSVLADLAHAEACLREREEEIERLKAGGFGTNDSAITMLTVTVKVSVPGLVLATLAMLNPL